MIRAKEHLTPEGLAKIQELHAQMNLKRDRSTKGFHGTIEITDQWLQGFVEAEGSFYISVTPNKTSALGYRVVATFSISQTECEKPVLEAIQKHLGCGFIKTKPVTTPGGRPVCEFKVNSFKYLLNKIIPFFDANPLLTTKILNYLDFVTVMRLVERKEHLTQSGLEEIRRIIAGMNRGRNYSNPANIEQSK